MIFEDANLENAVTWYEFKASKVESSIMTIYRTINGILARTGQVCVAASRVYVQRSIASKFIDLYCARMKEAVKDIGDPQEVETKFGPLADAAAFEKVQAMIARAKNECELAVGGNRIGDQGCFLEPTVFLNPKPDAEIYKNEVFGPVSVIKTFDTEAEVIELANDTEYGLMAGVFTRDINRAMRVSSKIESGVVGVNCVSVVCHFHGGHVLSLAKTGQMNIQVPFGGKKASGIGREFGEYVSILSSNFKSLLFTDFPRPYEHLLSQRLF